MNLQQYLEQEKNIQKCVLDYVDNESHVEENYHKIIQIFNNQIFMKEKYNLDRIFYLLMIISKHHHRFSSFFNKIEKILLFFKKDIQQIFTNSEIFKIFKGNKRILLFLFEEKVLIPDRSIVDLMLENKKYQQENYFSYFFPEIKSFLNETEKEIVYISDQIDFNNKRKIGENDEFICKLIRDDLIDEFISHVKKTNLSLNTLIKQSIFETNSFLLKKNEHSLIEYSAFFGSMQIFKYLHLNGVKLTVDLCTYSIHGYNPEMIHYLEENHVLNTDFLYNEILNESIKCHHNEIVNYIQSNLLNNHNENDFNFIVNSIKYSNYLLFPYDLNNEFSFYYLCQYNYIAIVKFLVEGNHLNYNKKVIQKLTVFFIKFQL